MPIVVSKHKSIVKQEDDVFILISTVNSLGECRYIWYYV